VQTLIRAFLCLLLAHLLTDFVFQTSRLVHKKKSGKLVGYLEHGAIHYLSAVVIAGFFIPGSVLSARFQLVVIGLTLVHLAIDFCKIALGKSGIISDGALPFVVDQILHVATVVLAACLITGGASASALRANWNALRAQQNQILLLLVVYVTVIFASGYLIRFLTKPLTRHLAVSESQAALSNAGMYIGWLERFLVLTALLLHSPATVGLIIAAKSIARYPEFHREQFAEYFLIGTLLSICTAFVGGVLLLKVFFGNSILPQ
jgi:Protein of unknown function (DUF3307)